MKAPRLLSGAFLFYSYFMSETLEEVKKKLFTQWGNPILQEPTKLVKKSFIKTPEFQTTIDKMFAIMEGIGWGIAANQLGMPMRFAIIEIRPIEKHPDWSVVPPTVLINPEILEKSKDFVYNWEACLSCPNETMFYVPRSSWIKVKYLDRNAKTITEKVEGLAAIVYQHEIDHLDGHICGERVLVVDGKVAKGAIMALDEWRKHHEVPEGAKHLVSSENNRN